MFTNKHVIAALIVTPILAVLGYFAVDALVSEKPHQAVKGASYKLVAKPNCRYSSGVCELTNGDFEVRITLDQEDNQLLLTLESVFPLEGGKVSLSAADEENPLPSALYAVDEQQRRWQTTFFQPYTGVEMMHIVLAADGSLYYGETVAAFAEYETSYGEDFRR